MSKLALQQQIVEAAEERSDIAKALLALQSSLGKLEATVLRMEHVLASPAPAVNAGMDKAVEELQSDLADIRAQPTEIAHDTAPTSSDKPHVVLELAAPVVCDAGDGVVAIDATSLAAPTPTTCSMECPNHGITTQSFTAFPEALLTRPHMLFVVTELDNLPPKLDVTQGIKQQDQVPRPMPWPSFEDRSESTYSDTTRLQSWPPPPSMHGSVPTWVNNPWFRSWLDMLLFGDDRYQGSLDGERNILFWWSLQDDLPKVFPTAISSIELQLRGKLSGHPTSSAENDKCNQDTMWYRDEVFPKLKRCCLDNQCMEQAYAIFDALPCPERHRTGISMQVSAICSVLKIFRRGATPSPLMADFLEIGIQLMYICQAACLSGKITEKAAISNQVNIPNSSNSKDTTHVHATNYHAALFVTGNLSAQRSLDQSCVFNYQRRFQEVLTVADSLLSNINYNIRDTSIQFYIPAYQFLHVVVHVGDRVLAAGIKVLQRPWEVGDWSSGYSRSYMLADGQTKGHCTLGIDRKKPWTPPGGILSNQSTDEPREYFCLWTICYGLQARSSSSEYYAQCLTITNLLDTGSSQCFDDKAGQFQFQIAWSFDWEISGVGTKSSQLFIAEFNDALLQYELLSCTSGDVSFSVSEQVQWEIAWSLCYECYVFDNISMRFICGCSAAVIWSTLFQGHVEFSGNIYLKIMVPCSSLELVSCNLSQARASDFRNGCAVQAVFEFSHLMVWKMAWLVPMEFLQRKFLFCTTGDAPSISVSGEAVQGKPRQCQWKHVHEIDLINSIAGDELQAKGKFQLLQAHGSVALADSLPRLYQCEAIQLIVLLKHGGCFYPGRILPTDKQSLQGTTTSMLLPLRQNMFPGWYAVFCLWFELWPCWRYIDLVRGIVVMYKTLVIMLAPCRMVWARSSNYTPTVTNSEQHSRRTPVATMLRRTPFLSTGLGTSRLSRARECHGPGMYHYEVGCHGPRLADGLAHGPML